MLLGITLALGITTQTMAMGVSSAIPAPGDRNLKLLFPGIKLRNKEILTLAHQLKRVSPYADGYEARNRIQDELAAYGDEVIPYMVALTDKKKIGFYFLDPKGGVFGFISDNPYMTQSGEVISRIRDRRAIPTLKKLLFNPARTRSSVQLASRAKHALDALNAVYTPSEIEALADEWKRQYYLQFPQIRAEFDALMKQLSHVDRERIKKKVGIE